MRKPWVLVCVAATLIGCGGSPSALGTGTGASANDGARSAFEFAGCMRSHGVTDFPDPVVTNNGNQQSVGIHIAPGDKGSPAFKAAQQACQSILPQPSAADQAAQQRQQEQHTRDIVAFASCLRTHGFPSFPDPSAQGELSPQTVAADGVDLQSPAFGTAARVCIPASHGAITAAQIAQAQSGNYGGSHASSTSR